MRVCLPLLNANQCQAPYHKQYGACYSTMFSLGVETVNAPAVVSHIARGGRAARSMGGKGGGQRGLARGGWCCNPLSTAPPYVFGVCFHIVKTMTLGVDF